MYNKELYYSINTQIFSFICSCIELRNCSMNEAKIEIKKYTDYTDSDIEKCLNYKKCNITIEYDSEKKLFYGHVSLSESQKKEIVAKTPYELHDTYIKTVQKYIKTLPKTPLDLENEIIREEEKWFKRDVRNFTAEGMSPEKIAEVTGYPIEKVKKVIESDRKRFEALLKKARENTKDN